MDNDRTALAADRSPLQPSRKYAAADSHLVEVLGLASGVNTGGIAVSATAPAPQPPSTAPDRSGTSFTRRERSELFALGGALLSAEATSLAVIAAQGRIALLCIAFGAACFVAWLHFADFTKTADDEPPTGMTGKDLDDLIDEVDRLQGLLPARAPRAPQPRASTTEEDVFTRLVRDALDELPDFMQKELPNVAVIVSDEGRTIHPSGQPLYGWYSGGTVLDDRFLSHIYIFRDTLVDAYRHDPDELRKQVTITVRHELMHHLGEMSELRIRELGL